MANINTIAAAPYSQLANPLTSVNFFPSIVGGSNRLILSAGQAGAATVGSSLASTPIEDGKIFIVKCVIRIKGNTTTNFTPSLYFWGGTNTDLTTTGNGDAALLTTSAYAVNSTTQYWTVEAHIVWNGSLGQFGGWIVGMSGATSATLISPVALSNIPITAATIGVVRFCAGGFFSGTDAGNLMSLMQFEIDKL